MKIWWRVLYISIVSVGLTGKEISPSNFSMKLSMKIVKDLLKPILNKGS
jgi:hypothetical protein